MPITTVKTRIISWSIYALGSLKASKGEILVALPDVYYLSGLATP
jgi:hypothetical protein